MIPILISQLLQGSPCVSACIHLSSTKIINSKRKMSDKKPISRIVKVETLNMPIIIRIIFYTITKVSLSTLLIIKNYDL